MASAAILQIKSELQAYRVGHLEDVRIIRNRSTGASRQFGFIRFPSVDESRAFLERNYPTIYLYGNASKDAQAKSVRVAFSRERNDRERGRPGPKPDPDWTCTNCSMLNYARRVECLRCKLARSEVEKLDEDGDEDAEPFVNTGDSDVSPDSSPSHFLLFRALESSVTEEILAKGASKLLRGDDEASQPTSKPSVQKIVSTSTVAHAGARPDCIKRVLLVRDRQSDESWRYGFVEFASVEDAQAALAKFNSLEKFTIASKPVMVSYIHAGVFVPVLKPPRNARVTFAASNNPNLKLSYWDHDAYVSLLVVSDNEDQPTASSEPKNAQDSSTPAPGKSTAKEPDAKPKKRKAEAAAPGGSTKKMASHLQFWTDRHNELHGIDSTASDAENNDQPSHGATSDPAATITTTTTSAPNTNPSSDKSAAPTTTTTTTTHQRSYADPVKNCCYLCSRQFKTSAEVNKHERLSELHQKNLQDADLVRKATARLEKAGVPSNAAGPSSSEYRDRAKERRQAFNQPKQPGSSAGPKPSEPPGTSVVTGAQAAEPDGEEGQKSKSKGASMLASMGYVAGQGLGAAGAGIQTPIAQDLYREGVGLGAEGGKVGDAVEEAGRATRGNYNEFAEKTKEMARQRFERLG